MELVHSLCHSVGVSVAPSFVSDGIDDTSDMVLNGLESGLFLDCETEALVSDHEIGVELDCGAAS